MNILRKLLLPFSLLYGSILAFRNLCYDKRWFKSKSYAIPIICVGNLSTGGTGKSPMIEYLISFLKEDYKVAVLSRGYKRKTNGFREVIINSTAEDVGDEPLQFKRKFPEIMVVVCADRQEGIEKIRIKADVILLDDAFQHRKVSASTNILLTTFDDLYVHDMVLPAGNLRESKRGAKRADLVMVTKCPEKHSHAKLQEIQYLLNLKPTQKIYFSKIIYDDSICGISKTLPLNYLLNKNFTLVTGIANSKPLVEFLKQNQFNFEHKKFPDHHHFSDSEIKNFKEKEIILTTEKDFVRLEPRLNKFAIYYLPIKTAILNKQEKYFKEYIINEIENFSTNN
ncbi:MAG: tetraacyldisaccharide 4'-kinase [Flavobacteriaceae bacterium]|jgi:tetraacyldisaccharide 4'-kinase|nr:tetraacyldisaccharide 4'-kinase [Flavobacteriaceae bacterium]MBT6705341.1 tetraacyldisaccharide 4'-kinase [Flavobacteriaceae bacterium]MDG2052754.1 tetraacyldisaccharide 4'-kinase [Flavobacteriaceae bacterium]|tara:strand:- start:446 stop:1462 length:1017 start_codon:yes stop_codon:yes gene_type:complete